MKDHDRCNPSRCLFIFDRNSCDNSNQNRVFYFVLKYESFVDRAVLNTGFVEWDFIHVV